MRYKNETKEKSNGVIYTPEEMANFLSNELISYHINNYDDEIYVLDPAVGNGELLLSIGNLLKKHYPNRKLVLVGYETDKGVAETTSKELINFFPDDRVEIIHQDFLSVEPTVQFDFIIANPPYIRTQILGTDKAQELANRYSLSGRIDIYYAFLLYTKSFLKIDGIAGYITSNKFFTIKSGATVRDYMIENYQIKRIVDFGDTKLFNASVLPCIVVFSNGRTSDPSEVEFTSIYQTDENEQDCITSVFEKIGENGVFSTSDGRKFSFKQGTLCSVEKSDLWTISSDESKQWLKTVEKHTAHHLFEIGKIRVGIKTTADNVFIGDSWTGELSKIELLRPLITHRNAGKIIPNSADTWQVLYTHTSVNGKKAAYDIEKYPYAKEYLYQHYEQLSSRSYVQKAHRNWYEIWVPQNPDSWKARKIVFRDISETPQFWLDESGAIVNGDCYWIEINSDVSEEMVYLTLAVVNSKFIEKYYDTKFHTKLYSGKRRFMTQYVEEFPLPSLDNPYAQKAIAVVKKIISGLSSEEESRNISILNSLVDSMFTVTS
ncbi:TaqI-like C-terminal specificity domain-containing protein [Ruminococcus sp. YE71]|uniref:Eco57I restriction-modification methylase domain-containing protein n=1 Tax=unclassified Ruminococcus TaxID=2608920 RepID=UPI00088E3E4A|nr:MULTISPECIES: N-6 DNA methylase [unclassified Ruminococcus]SDA24954.1 TaqI-like C-terminal specificity domain-containing protein [Ruminococcus sp. YE78]SFW43216.1 TaqI-like C-terminal specificity domain-containing protein [Ruminococcus sp. YE71]